MYVGHFNGYISSFLTRRHNTRAQFQDTKDEEIHLREDLDENYEGELYGVNYKEEIIDIKDNPIIIEETGDNECRDGCASLSLMEDVTYSCEQCDYMTTVNITLTQHIESNHQGLGKVVNSDIKRICDQTQREDIIHDSNIDNEIQDTELGVFGEIDFLEHIQSYSGKMYSCGQCNFNSSYQHCLIRHKKSKHEGVVYCCDQCDFITPHSSNLKVHKKAKHLGIKYVCDQCDVSVKYKKI